MDADQVVQERTQIEVRVVFGDGSQESRTWSWADVRAGRHPMPDIEEWMVDPRKSWQHPQDPIILSTLVAEGREQEARQWLSDL
jgi:hypothetical protein